MPETEQEIASVPAPVGETPHGRPILSLEEVGVSYRRRRGLFSRPTDLWAVRSVTMDIYEGETVGVIGRNGAGKSTLLKVLAGIIKPDRGRLEVHSDHRVSLLSLQVGFLQYLSGRENVYLSGLLLGMTKRELDLKIDEIIAFAELDQFIDEPIGTYSAGMRARLGFSTAFHVDPEILLVDEVLGVGDAEFVAKSQAVMRERIRSDKTVVLVSHSAASIRELCDRAVWIDKGRSMASGPTEDVLVAYIESTKKAKTKPPEEETEEAG